MEGIEGRKEGRRDLKREGPEKLIQTPLLSVCAPGTLVK